MNKFLFHRLDCILRYTQRAFLTIVLCCPEWKYIVYRGRRISIYRHVELSFPEANAATSNTLATSCDLLLMKSSRGTCITRQHPFS